MTIEEILKHNKESYEKKISLVKEIEKLQKGLIPPCEYCPYDGIYRCESCQDNCYEGFNKKEYSY